MKGMFITFEGGEGVGKSTQVPLVGEKLRQLGHNVLVTREPGGTELGEKIRALLRSSELFDPISELLLIFATRREHFVTRIAPHLEQGYIVLCDRFYDSSLVYQGILRGIPIEKIMELKQLALGNFEPDLTIVLDMNAEKASQRLKERQMTPDEYDLMGVEKRELVRQGFLKLAEIFSFRSVVIDADCKQSKVFSNIINVISEKCEIKCF